MDGSNRPPGFSLHPLFFTCLPCNAYIHVGRNMRMARYGHGSYDPIERIWRWLPSEQGPFEAAAEFKAAWRKMLADEAAGDSLRLYIVSDFRLTNQSSGWLWCSVGQLPVPLFLLISPPQNTTTPPSFFLSFFLSLHQHTTASATCPRDTSSVASASSATAPATLAQRSVRTYIHTYVHTCAIEGIDRSIDTSSSFA